MQFRKFLDNQENQKIVQIPKSSKIIDDYSDILSSLTNDEKNNLKSKWY